MKKTLIALILVTANAVAQTSKTPIKNGILQSDLDAAGYKILSSNMADYAGTGMTWNVSTGKFDVTGGGGGAVTSVFGRTGAVVAATNDYSFAQIGSKPTTLSGYGITDPVVLTSGSYPNPSWITSLTWSKITGDPTTLAGYGITDAQPLDSDLTSIAALSTTSFGRGSLTQVDAAGFRAYIGAGTSSFDGTFASLTGKPTTLVGYGITDAQPLDGDLTAIAALTGTNTIYYRSASNTWTPVTVGSNMTFSSGTLNAVAGGSGTVTDFSAGDLSPLFTTTEVTTTTTPALSFSLTSAGANTVFGRAAGTSGAPTYSSSPQFTAIGNLTSNGFVKTGSGTGALSVDTATYLTGNQNISLTGDVTGGPAATSISTTIANNAVTYAKMQNVSANSVLLGSSATGSGSPPSQIVLGTNLSMSGSTLNATSGGGGNVSNTGTPVNNQLAVWTAATTIEGDSTLTYSGGATGVLEIGGTDVGLSRNAANVLEVDNGTAGQWGALRVGLRDAATASNVASGIIVAHQTTSTAAANFSSNIEFRGDSNGGTDRAMAIVGGSWATATDASRQPYGYMIVSNNSGSWGTAGLYVYNDGFITNSRSIADPGSSIIDAVGGFRINGAAATSGKILQGNGTSMNYSTATWPTAVGTKGTNLRWDGTNVVSQAVPYGVVTATVDQTAVTETAHVVYTVPANSAAIGTTYRIAAWGDMDNGTTAITFTPRVRWGGTGGTQLLATPTVVGTTTALTGKTWRFIANVTTRTIGATGTAFTEVQLSNHSSQTSGAYAGDEASSGGTGVTVNTTTSNDLDLTWTLSATTGTPHVRTYGGYVEIIN